ncbi:MAG TPA: ATP-binding protein [Dehalococcoidia bacterium]|nr:ATP-binding protein [Dehalococcoidia bacterium]
MISVGSSLKRRGGCPIDLLSAIHPHPCFCGYYGDPVKECRCSSGEITRYHKRISGPLLDRIDIFVDVPRIEYERLSEDRLGERSEKVQ